MNKNTEKDKRLEEVLANIEKQFGKGSIMKLGEHEHQKIEVSPTGSISLDLALGVGGYPKGRIIEIYGPESSGKTTIALHAIAEVQKQGGRAAFIDAEHALDPVYASNLGVDIDELLLSQPDTGEQALEICDALVRSEALSIIVIDSVAALVPQAEIDGEIGDNQIGLQARLMSRALRKLSGSISKTQTIVIFINQLREKVGVIFGNPETTPGGKALKYYSSVRLDIRRGEQIKNNSEILGNKTNIKVVKNKVAPPFKTTTIEIIYGQGISRLGEIIDLFSNIKIKNKIFEKIRKLFDEYSKYDENIILADIVSPEYFGTVDDIIKFNDEITFYINHLEENFDEKDYILILKIGEKIGKIDLKKHICEVL